jgi:hypothetical protein
LRGVFLCKEKATRKAMPGKVEQALKKEQVK